MLARDGENGFTVSPEDEAELLLSIAEADRGETISGEEVLAKIARRRGRIGFADSGHEDRGVLKVRT